MTNLFLQILNASITASWLIGAVVLVRLVIKRKAPRWIVCLLWGLVAVRLVLPFEVESSFSLVPETPKITLEVSEESAEVSAEPECSLQAPPAEQLGNISRPTEESTHDSAAEESVPEESTEESAPEISTPEESTEENVPETSIEESLEESVEESTEESAEESVEVSAEESIPTIIGGTTNPPSAGDSGISAATVAGIVWLCGLVALAVYATVNYLLLKKQVAIFVPDERGFRRCEAIDTPFVLGFFRPRIYLPYGLSSAYEPYILAHEQAHIRRLDHLIKPIAYFILAIHWFNPLVWLSFVLFCKDIEYACDEKVLENAAADIRKDYAFALLECASKRSFLAASPIAFGEVSVKNRVKKTMSYKKPLLWVMALCIILCALVAVLFCTSPASKADSASSQEQSTENVSETLSEEQSTESETANNSSADELEISEDESEPEISEDTSTEEPEPEVSDEVSEDVSEPENNDDPTEEPDDDAIVNELGNKIYPELRDDPNHEHEIVDFFGCDDELHWSGCACGKIFLEDPHYFGTWEDADGNTLKRTCQFCGYVQYSTKPSSQKLAYKVNPDGKTCTITGIGTYRDSHLIIPDTIDGYTVTVIGEQAFVNYQSYSALSVPATIQRIEEHAFYRQLVTRQIDLYIEDLSAWCSIDFDKGGYFLQYVKRFYVNGKEIKDLVIPPDVTDIGDYVFYNGAFSSITFHENVKTIGERSFAWCQNLTELHLPENVTLGKEAFWKCTGIETLTIPGGVTLGNSCFTSMGGLKQLTISEGVTVIPVNAFYYCDALEVVVLPTSIREVHNSAFQYCNALKSFTLPEGVEYVHISAFSRCDNLKELYLPSTLIEISGDLENTRLKSVYYNGSLEQWYQVDRNFRAPDLRCTMYFAEGSDPASTDYFG